MGNATYTDVFGNPGNAGASEAFRVDTVVQTLTFDFGDAPASYPVALAQDGARHTTGTLFLGNGLTVESDGIASEDASSDGDDGVTALATALVSSDSNTISSLAIVASEAGKLDAWIDFDGDGSWSPSEQILSSVYVAAGANTVSYTIPSGAVAAGSAARFRLSTAGGLAVTGAATDGEVEDYIIPLQAAGGTGSVNVTSINAGTATIETSGTDIVVRERDTILFQGPATQLAVLDFVASDGDDTILIGASFMAHSIQPNISGGPGRDLLKISGANHSLDGTTLGKVSGIDVIDIMGDGPNTLSLNESETTTLPDNGRSLRVLLDQDDSLNVAVDTATNPANMLRITDSFAEGGRFYFTATSDQAELEIGGLSWTNPLGRLDVNNSGMIDPIDALQIVNQLTRREFVIGSSTTLIDPQDLEGPHPLRFFDTSGDGNLTPIDALRVINGVARGEGEPESEQTIVAAQTSSLSWAERFSDDIEALNTLETLSIPTASSSDATSIVVARADNRAKLQSNDEKEFSSDERYVKATDEVLASLRSIFEL